jgi:hypothetical protein
MGLTRPWTRLIPATVLPVDERSLRSELVIEDDHAMLLPGDAETGQVGSPGKLLDQAAQASLGDVRDP